MNFNTIWLWLCILSLKQLILPNYGFPTCTEYCAAEGEFCTSDENPDCGTWGYDQCEGCRDGYWGKGSSTVCVSCLETIGCTDCEDYKGCLSCDYGGERIWWGECEVHYCDGAGTQPIETTSEPETTESEVTATTTSPSIASGQPSTFPTGLPTTSPFLLPYRPTNETESPSTNVPVFSESLFVNTTATNQEEEGSKNGHLTMTHWIGISVGLFIFIVCIIIVILIALRAKKIKPVNQTSEQSGCTHHTMHVTTAVKGDTKTDNGHEFEREIEGLDADSAIPGTTLKVDVINQTDDDIEIGYKSETNINEKVKTTKRKSTEKGKDGAERMFQNEGNNTSTGNTARETLNRNASNITNYEVENDENSQLDVIDTMQNLKTSNVK